MTFVHPVQPAHPETRACDYITPLLYVLHVGTALIPLMYWYPSTFIFITLLECPGLYTYAYVSVFRF